MSRTSQALIASPEQHCIGIAAVSACVLVQVEAALSNTAEACDYSLYVYCYSECEVAA
jgi:hypothetical protein